MKTNVFMIFFISLACLAILTTLMTLNFLITNYTYILLYPLISLSYISLKVSLIYDWMTLAFLTTVLIISMAVVLYSHNYMGASKYTLRFCLILMIFILSMMMLLMSNNFLTLLLGWDGLGLSSYGLVIFYQNASSSASAMITALSNRMGDTLLLISLALMFNNFNYNLFIFTLSPFSNIIITMIVFAAFTKSAQIPFSAWLPEAMAAPTPISSLVHSSTLVAAGVFLLVRFYPSIDSPLNMLLFSSLAAATMIMSAISANLQFDLKKIIALSTLSQLALMMTILFLGHPKLAFFHLITHAMFKALLFLTAGIIIHNNFNCQDIRLLGSLTTTNPVTMTAFILANFCLCGAPFMSGFYSKDLIIESYTHNNNNLFIHFSLLLGMFLTCMYTFRLFMYLTHNSSFNFPLSSSTDSHTNLIYPVLFMSFMALLTGATMSWLIFPFPSPFSLTLYEKLMPLMLLLLAIYFNVHKMSLKTMNTHTLLHLFSTHMWTIPFFSTTFLNSPTLSSAIRSTKILDLGWGEFIGPQNMWQKIMSLNMPLVSSQFNLTKTFLIPGISWALLTLIILML